MGSRQRGRYQMRSYQTAKLAVITWIYGLARHWVDPDVTANLLDPGSPAARPPFQACMHMTDENDKIAAEKVLFPRAD